ncbi:hypothetical protein [Peribacillus sp. CSMR9]|uniref:hypothetical protein n=1 Tax=Peribacillus TaxID=2675229 RepID=UPI000B67E083|nr:hypothetical protein [Peribacillus sp. CSMR9]MDV7766948.1 hypothetical protein [Peribacillus sp. CSMR9]SNT47615.1 hypothetical protein SAMN05444672_13029 [Bacillus sp. OK838]
MKCVASILMLILSAYAGRKKQFQKTKGSDNAIRIGYQKFGSLIFKNQQGNWKRI